MDWDKALSAFASIAKYLRHPLVLAGFGVWLLFGLYHALLGAGLLSQVGADTTGHILFKLLDHAFWVGLAIILPGFGFKYYQEHHRHREAMQPEVDLKTHISPLAADIIRNLTEHIRQKQECGADQCVPQVEAMIQAVRALTEQKDAPGLDAALQELAEGHTEKAEAIFAALLERKDREGTTAHQEAATAARHLGALAFLHDTQKSLTAYRRAVALDPENANGWNQLGRLLMRIGDLTGAEAAYGRVMILGEKTGDKELLAVATGNLGLIHRTRGNLDKAEEMHLKSLAIEQELGRKEGMASDYGNLGNVHLTRGDLDKAEEMFLKGLAIDQELGRKEGMANDYGNLGIVYRERGDLDKAEEMHLKSLAINQELGRKEGMAIQYGNLGIVYQTRGDLDKAEEMHLKGLAIDQELGRKEGMASKYGNLGNVYRKRGDLDKAEEMYLKSLAIEQELGRKEGMANDYGNLGVLYAQRGKTERAWEAWQRALSLFQEVGAAPQVEQTRALLRKLDEQPDGKAAGRS